MDLFCIHTDFLVPYRKNIKNIKYKRLKYVQHFFLNCDCCLNDKNECYYNEFITDEKWKKLYKENLQNSEEGKEEDKTFININSDEKKKNNKIPFGTKLAVAGGIACVNPLLGLGYLVSWKYRNNKKI